MKENVDIVGTVGLLGSFVLILSTLLQWGTCDLVMGNYTYGFSGWDLYSGYVDLQYYSVPILDVTDYTYTPAVAMGAGFIGIVTAVVGVLGNSRSAYRALTAVSVILALASAVLAVLYHGDISAPAEAAGIISFSPSYGVWVAVVGAVLVIVGGVGKLTEKIRA